MTNPITNEFYLTQEYVAENLDKYYLLHWQGSYLMETIRQSPLYFNRDCIVHQDTKYIVIFQDVTPWHLVNNQSEQYRLSFRLEKSQKYGYVLIKRAPIK